MTVHHTPTSKTATTPSHQPVNPYPTTTNKVIKVLENVVLATGSLSISMPLALIVSAASGVSAGLATKAALTALCAAVLKAFGIATITALGTVGTFGLIWAIPVILFGISFLILRLSNAKESPTTETHAKPSENTIVWKPPTEEMLLREWEEHANIFAQIVEQCMISSSETTAQDIYKHLIKFQDLKEPVLTSACFFFKKLAKSQKTKVDIIKIHESNIIDLITVCFCLADEYQRNNSIEKNDYLIQMSETNKKNFNERKRLVRKYFNSNLTITPEEFRQTSKELSAN